MAYKFISVVLLLSLTASWISCDSGNSEVVTNSDDNIVDSDREHDTESVQDTDTVTDGVVDDQCPGDPNKTEPGECGCGVPEGSCDACPSGLVPHEELFPGEYICSPNGEFSFGLTMTGQLAIWSDTGTRWSAGNFGDASRLIMQGDGNLVVYDQDKPLWSTTTQGNSGAVLKLEDTCRIVISLDGNELWSASCEGVEVDLCPDDPNKTEPGLCGCGVEEGTCGVGEITHIGTTEVWDADGQDISIDLPKGSKAGDLLVLALHRTDDDLPLFVEGWTRVAECYKRDNGYDCSTEADCIKWLSDNFCDNFGEGGGGHDLAQSIFFKEAGTDEPNSYKFNLNFDSSGHPGWIILSTLRGAETSDPVRDWSFKGCDGDNDSIFPSVYGEKGDMVLLSQSFDDAVAQERFGPPAGTSSFGYVSYSDEAGFLFGGILTSTGDTGPMRTTGPGASGCKDALVSLTIKPQ